VDSSGQTVFLESPMGIFENKSGWILMLGFTPRASGLFLGQHEERSIKNLYRLV
jgi:hypothetical protein